jgi:transposase-like protein
MPINIKISIQQVDNVRSIKIPPDILTEDQCIAYLQNELWGGIPTCPYCQSERATVMKERGRYHCNNCNSPYSITAQTVFHNSHLPLHKWFVTVAAVLESSKDRISARKLATLIEVNRNTASDMINRINEKKKEAKHRVLLEAITTMVLAVRDNVPKD